jgi:uncharacterized membrane protein YeaQ/YmgE (transglycosylase-associated protein family)
MQIIAWLVIGFIAGLIARAIVPGKQAMGIVATTLLGIAGSLIGGLVGSVLGGGGRGFTPSGIIGSIIGAIVLLFIIVAVQRRRHVPA